MVHFSTSAVTAVLSFCSTALSAPTTELQERDLSTIDPSSLLLAPLKVPSTGAKSKFIGPAPTIIDLRLTGNDSIAEVLPNVVGSVSEPETSKRNILGGADNRVYWSNRDYPYSAMGRLWISAGTSNYICSGSLIGPRHVLTARHCIVDGVTHARFQPAYNNGEVLGGSDVIAMFRPDYGQTGWCANSYDWSIFVLNDRLGDKYGTLGLKTVNPDTQLNQAMFFHYGYPGDKGGNQPYRQEAISASAATWCDRGSPVVTDADSAEGQSGGPLWILENGLRFVYAAIVGGNDAITVGAGGPSLMQGYPIVMKDYP